MKGAPLVAEMPGIAAAGAAQDYPGKPIRFVVGFTPGGSSDSVAGRAHQARVVPDGSGIARIQMRSDCAVRGIT